MNRKRLETEMVKMGFYVSHNGYRYIADAVELMIAEEFGIRGMDLYKLVGTKNKATAANVERCIREAIHRMYEKPNPIPVELTPDSRNGALPNMEFITRFAMLAREWGE